MLDNDEITRLVVRFFGTMVGVLASLILVAPVASRNLGYRVAISLAMGFIFAPILPGIWGFGFLAGEHLEFVMARGAAMGFAIWSILEFWARMLSSTEWLERLVREVIRLKVGGKDE